MTSTEGYKQESGLAAEIEAEAYRRLFPLQYYERHLAESVRPDSRGLGRARNTTIALGSISHQLLEFSISNQLSPSKSFHSRDIFPPSGPVTSADGSALVKIGDTTVLAAIKLEVMTPCIDSPDEGSVAVDFQMPPICSPVVRPGRPAEVAPVISKQLSDVIMSSGMINLKELSLISGKAAWMAYLDIYCLNADGSLFDAALLSATAAFSHLQIPLVSLNDDGKVITVSEELKCKAAVEPVNKENRKLAIEIVPFSLTCIVHDKYILADPTSEEESVMDTHVTVVFDSKGRLVSLYKAGGAVLLHTSVVKDCIALAKLRVEELSEILRESLSAMEVD